MKRLEPWPQVRAHLLKVALSLLLATLFSRPTPTPEVARDLGLCAIMLLPIGILRSRLASALVPLPLGAAWLAIIPGEALPWPRVIAGGVFFAAWMIVVPRLALCACFDRRRELARQVRKRSGR